MAEVQKLNRIKAVLAEKDMTGKELAAELEVNPATVSRWAQNITQPDLQTLVRIARALGVNVKNLLNDTE